MKTSIERERAEQARWVLQPQYAGIDWFDRQIPREFSSDAERETAQLRRLKGLLTFAGAAVPHYRHVFRERGFNTQQMQAPAELERLPILRKSEIFADAKAFLARRLPPGQRIASATQSSGTTAQPVRIVQTQRWLLGNILAYQRQYRWFRFDPGRVFGMLRMPDQLPPLADGSLLEDGDVGRFPNWPRIGDFFRTGPLVTFNLTNPLDSRLQWLAAERVDYLVAFAQSLEYLAFACGAERRLELSAVVAISEVLTPDMRATIATALRARVHQNYGLNEAGLVASRCPEGNRYHVHTEHCLVEIVDADGRPVEHGARGRILVTVLTNPAMPLVRYDTDDLAVCYRDRCPCGRTLPSFGEVIGRYGRMAFLPAGSMQRVGAVRTAIARAPMTELRTLERYQLHQYRDNRFELRLQATAPVSPALIARIEAAWPSEPAPYMPLEIRANVDIPVGPGGKHQDFTSDHAPPADAYLASLDDVQPRAD